MSYISLEFPLLLVCLTDKKFLHCDYPDWLRCSETSLVIKILGQHTVFATFGKPNLNWLPDLWRILRAWPLYRILSQETVQAYAVLWLAALSKIYQKATCDLYLVDVVVALSVGEGFEVFKVFVGQVDADVVGVIVSRKEGGRRHCGVRQRRRISLSYPVLVPTE